MILIKIQFESRLHYIDIIADHCTCIIIHNMYQSTDLLIHFLNLKSQTRSIKSSIYVTIMNSNHLMSTCSQQPISYNYYVYPHIVILICIHVAQYIHFFYIFFISFII